MFSGLPMGRMIQSTSPWFDPEILGEFLHTFQKHGTQAIWDILQIPLEGFPG